MNSYDLSRAWFDWCFENTEKISPNHTALYFFCIEQCNRLGWKEKFGLPTEVAKEAIGIRSYNTYINTLNDLVEFGFIKLIEKSKNQFTSNIIALSKINKANDKALDKALIKQRTKQPSKPDETTEQSIDSINKQLTTNKEPLNNKTIEQRKADFSLSLNPFLEKYISEFGLPGAKDMLNKFYLYWTESNDGAKKFRAEMQKTWNLEGRIRTWATNEKNFTRKNNGPKQSDYNQRKAAAHELGKLAEGVLQQPFTLNENYGRDTE